MNLKSNVSNYESVEMTKMLNAYDYSEETINNIKTENLLPLGLLKRLHNNYSKSSGLFRDNDPIFTGKTYYSGVKGFREILSILKEKGIELENVKEREFFIEVYRFMATKQTLNIIDWNNYKKDQMYHLVFPETGMIPKADVQTYINAKNDQERAKIVEEYQKKTNPHDGKQKLNKPWLINDQGQIEILQGAQHKYPPVKLLFDKSTQNCFAFCTYCFRHAQVRGDEDMFVQHDISMIHRYLKQHKEVSDFLITGGDGGFITYERLEEYVKPIIEEPELSHIKSIRIGSRGLTFHPEHFLSDKFAKHLQLLNQAILNGIQVVWVAHLSTPFDVLNPGTIAAIRRLRNFGLTIKSQSPIMNHISLFQDENGKYDIDKSAQNWIDLGNIIAMLGVGFHSMYCARPTGEHHYFTAPLAVISKVFDRVYRGLASINRPSRFITMTSSSGKISLMGTTEINGDKVFVLKFNEARNMKWMDKVMLAEYNEKENTIEKLKPYKSDKYFFEQELKDIEAKLEADLKKEMETHAVV